MERIDWKEAFSVGIKELDDDHRQWLYIFNRLVDARDEGKGVEALGRILTELVHYTQYHLTHEEYLLTEMGYPEFDAHCAEHKALVGRIEKARADFAGGPSDGMTDEILNMIRGWLVNHIRQSDRMYAEHFGTV